MDSGRRLWAIGSGIVLALLAGEFGMRVVETAVPPASPWPTVEAEVKSSQLARLSQDVDVVFLGSSVTEAAIDPELLIDLTGVALVYNAALPFSSRLSDEVWLEGVVLESVWPTVVVLGVPVWPVHSFIEDDPLRGGIEGTLASIANPRSLESLALVRNKGVFASWDERRTRHQSAISNLWTDLGHMTGYYERPPQTLVGRFGPFGEPRMSNDNIEALRRTVRTLEDAGIQGILMIEPGHFPGDVSDSDLAIYLESIKALGRDLRVPVWDTYGVGWNPEYFVDEAHFNREGTVAFTSFLADLIIEMDEP